MIRSMTGYGRSQQEINGMSITVELKSVNHRFFEFSSRVYRNYSFIEDKLRSFVQGHVSRGKVDCYVQIDALELDNVIVQVNHSLAAGYVNAYREVSERYSIPNDISVTALARQNDVFLVRKAPADEEMIWEVVQTVLKSALESFLAMKAKEGEKLRADVLSRADEILRQVDIVEQRSPETVREYNEKLISRMQDLLSSASIDEQRLLTEAALFADKIAVAEEVTRLRSHIDQLYRFMEAEESIGKTLDFLIQEINREINTIGSKASDVQIAKTVIALKTEVEKIREQIQNIE